MIYRIPLFFYVCALIFIGRMFSFDPSKAASSENVLLYKILNPSIMSGTYYEEHANILATNEISKIVAYAYLILGLLSFGPYISTFDVVDKSSLVLYISASYGLFIFLCIKLPYYLITLPILFYLTYLFLIA
jgi:hypothetical protein